MPDITTSLTIDQLKTATKAAIVADITGKMSKRDLIIAVVGSDKVTDAPVIKRRKDNQIESQLETERDIETGAVLGSRLITWTYYETGEVDEIATIAMDAAGKETSRRIIKHYTDGRQPESIK